LQNLDEDAKDLPPSAPTTMSIPFIPKDRVAARADRWFPSRMMTGGFLGSRFIPDVWKAEKQSRGEIYTSVRFEFF
jgi:hypothetical protein